MHDITWAEVLTECDGYKAGFVAVFRKYEGQKVEGVKVTQRTFADHLGIAKTTFNSWVRAVESGRAPVPRKMTDARTKGDVTRAARQNPAAVVDAIMELPETQRDHIYHEVKLRRAGEDRSPAGRKAAEAWVRETTDGIQRGISHIGLAGVPAALDECAADIDKYAGDLGPDSADLLAAIEASHVKVGAALELAKVLAGVSSR